MGFFQHEYLKKSHIKNKALAKELEEACNKNGGILTYAEYLQIEQFGAHGYHTTHTRHGKTDAHETWGKALALFCQKHKYTNIMEFGPGDGSLGIEMLKEAKQLGFNLQWIGIEVNHELHKIIRQQFTQAGLSKNCKAIVSSIKECIVPKKTLVIFAYCLDSVPPEVFLNTSSHTAFPNAMMGVTVANGELQEVVVPPKQLLQRKCSLKNGIYTSVSSQTFDLSSWQLIPGQRAYLSPQAFSLLSEISQKITKDDSLLIMDEFREKALPWEIRHLCVPKSLYVHSRTRKDIKKAYREAGAHLFYYPMYLQTYVQFLHRIGFQSLFYDNEEKMANEMLGKKFIPLRTASTCALLCSEKKAVNTVVLSILFSQRKFF